MLLFLQNSNLDLHNHPRIKNLCQGIVPQCEKVPSNREIDRGHHRKLLLALSQAAHLIRDREFLEPSESELC